MTARLAQPLTLVHTEACGSSGLNQRALAAAMWSHATRFELLDGEPWGIADVLRVAMCPLFDGNTPWPTRLESLSDYTLQGKTAQRWQQATARFCICPDGTEPVPASAAKLHYGTQSFVEVLQLAARQLPTPGADAQATAAILAVDSLLAPPLLKHMHQAKLLSTEELAQGLIPSEACAVLTVSAEPPTPRQAVVRGASAMPLGASPAQALVQAARCAVGDDSRPVHTVLWDIGPEAALLPAIAEAISHLGALVQSSQFVRPLQYIGATGGAFAAVATILAIEGSRAGITAGGRTLIWSLSPDAACAVLVEAPWHPPIMLADAPRPTA